MISSDLLFDLTIFILKGAAKNNLSKAEDRPVEGVEVGERKSRARCKDPLWVASQRLYFHFSRFFLI